MLSKEAIRVKVEGRTLVPQFLDPGRDEHVALAGAFLDAFRTRLGGSRGAIEEAAEEIALGARGPKMARGLAEVLFALATFERADGAEAARRRREVFARSAVARVAGAWNRPVVLGECGLDPAADLYPDLRGADRLSALPPLAAEGLLERYNRALVEALVAKAVALEGASDESLAGALEALDLPVRREKDGRFRVDLRKAVRGVQRRLPDALEALEKSRRSRWTWTVLWGRRRLELRGERP